MSVRSQRNMRDKLGIDSRGEPAFYRRVRSQVDHTRQYFEAVTRNYAVPEHVFSRASVATYRAPGGRAGGSPVLVPTGRERFIWWQGRTRTMHLIEQAITNYLLNSEAPATQTTGSLPLGSYCLWVEGTGSAAVTAGTGVATGLGTATAGTPVVFTVTTAGTFTVTKTGTLVRFQLENSKVPTSYLPTVGSTAARAAESLVWTPTATHTGLFGSAGTIALLAMLPSAAPAAVTQTIMQIDDGTDANRIVIENLAGGSTIRARFITSSSALATLTLGSMTAGVPFKVALAWAAGDQAGLMSGGTVQTATITPPAGTTRLRFGNTVAAGASANGGVGLISRALARRSNAMLQDMVKL